MIDPMISPRVASAWLGISRKTLQRMVRRGRLQAPQRVSPGRVGWPQSTIETYINDPQRVARRGAV